MIGKIRNVELGDVCDFLSGFPFKSTDFSSNPNDIFLVKGSNTGHQFIAFEVGPWLKVMDYQNYLKYELQEDDVIIAMDRPIVGDQLKYCWMKKNDPKSLLVQRMARLRGSQELDIKYLRYVIGGSEFKGYIDTITTGANVPHISGPDIKKFRFPLPPLKTQKKIAAILSAYDDLIENNLKRIKLLEEMAQITYEEWFVRMRFPGYESTPINPTTGLPVEWEKEFLGDLVTTQYGYTESAINDDSLPKFLRITDFNKASFINWPEVPNCPIDDKAYEKYKLEVGDVIVVRMADPGKVAIIEKDIRSVFASYCIRLRPKDKNRLTPYYFFYTLRAEQYQGFVFGASTGATRRSANAKTLTYYDIVIPAPEILGAFEEMVSAVRKVMNLYLDQNQRLREARDILLPRLMTGVIDVESYNPADLLKEVA